MRQLSTRDQNDTKINNYMSPYGLLIIIDKDLNIILGTETWFDDTISSGILPNDLGYIIQRRDRLTV